MIDSLVCSESKDNLRLAIRKVEDDGSVCFMLDGKLFKTKYVNEKGIRTTQMFPTVDFGQDNRCSSILRSGNDLWVGTLHGLYRLNLITGEARVYRQGDTEGNGLSNNEVSDLCFSEDGELVAGTLGGVEIYDPMVDSFIVYSSRANKYGNKQLPGSIVRCLKLHGDQLWVGMEVEGLAIMQKKRLPVINFTYRENDRYSIPATPVRSMIVDSHGRLWVGATEYGVGMDQGGMRFKFFNTYNSNLKHNTINAFCEDGKGRLWMGSVEGNLNCISLDNPSAITNPPDCDTETAKRINIINRIIYDKINDYLWILATTGLFIYDLKESRLTEYEEQLTLCLGGCIDSSSRLWISHMNGIKMIILDSMEARDYPEVPSSLALVPDEEGMWLGTFSYGLMRMEMNPDGSLDLKTYDEKDGLADNRIRGMLKDGSYLWITTDNGLSRFDTDDLSFESFGILDGLKSMAFCEGSIAQSTTGAIYIGQKEGLSMLLSSYISSRETENPKLVITGGYSGSQYIDLAYRKNGIEIKERDRSFTLFFSDLSFSDWDDISYESRILPDKDWTGVYGASKYVRYERIPGGNHEIQIRAVDRDGNVLSEDGLSLYVKPLFHKSWWFLILMVMFIGIMTQAVIRWRTKAIKRNKEQLQKEVDRQTRLLKEQKQQIQNKVDELSKQNEILQKQLETLAGNKILIYNDVANKDSKFMDDVMNAIQRLYKDPELDIYSFSEAVGMSRSMLNDKLQGVIGQSIAQFIRIYRLNVAKEIICNGIHADMNVSDLAYEVGFNDPKYFTRCFTQQFGLAPSIMINEVKRSK